MVRALALTLLLALPSVAAAQPIVRVRAETRIELQVERSPTVRVIATLRDDRGDALADRELTVRLSAPDGVSRGRAAARTDAQGRLEASFDVEPGAYRLEARYGGDESYRGVEVAQLVDLERAHVRLSMSAEAGGLDRLNLDEATHRVRVRAESEAGGADLAVRLENELQEVLASGTTAGDGTVVLDVSSADLGAPAAGRIVVRTEGDEERARAQTEVLVVRYRPTQVSLEASPESVEAGRALSIEGQLSTSEGPLARKAVGIFAGERHVETVLTDAEGRFAREVVLEENEGTVELQARFEADAPWRPDASSEPVSVHVEPRGSTPVPWLLVPIAFCALVLLTIWWRGRQREVAAAPARTSMAPAPPGIVLGDPSKARDAGRRDVGGVVLDADEAEPLDGSRVRLEGRSETLEAETDEHGVFSFDEVPEGAWRLRVDRTGYEGRETQITVPHRGRLASLEVRLRSLRQVAIRHYRPLAEALAPSRRWWAFWTPRELAERARGSARREVGEVTRDVEEAAYAATPPNPDQVDGIGERAGRLAGKLTQDKGTR